MKLEKLGNLVLEIKTGKTPPTKKSEYFGEEINWYTPTDLDHNKDLTKSTRGITQLAINDKKAILYKPNTVLIGCIGDIGKIGITRNFSSSNQQITGVLPNEKLLYPDYLYYWLKSNKKVLQNASTNSIVAILNNKQLREIDVILPEKLIDQIRIAEVLTKTETLIKQRKESIVLLDDFMRSTFFDMFRDPVKNEKKWEKTFLDKISSQITDGEHTTPIRIEKGIKLLSARNIKDGFIDFEKNLDYISEAEYLRISKRCKPEKGDILMSCSGSVGRVSIINTDEQLSLVRSVALIKPISDIVNPYYLQFWMQSPYFQNEVKKGSKTSSQSNIFTGAIKKLPVILPPIKLQNKFASIVEKAEKVKEQYKESLKELENLFGSLSQKAFKGELDLSKLDVSAQIREIEKKVEEESGLDISLETKLTKQMQQFIKQTADIQKRLALANNMIPKALLQQIENINKTIEPFQNLNKIPEQLALAMKSFDGIKSITSQLNQEAKEQFQTKLTWEEVNFEMVANWIKDEYSEYHFNSEILMNFLENERVTFSNYHSSEELKTNPKLNEADDIKSFVFSALKGKNQFIRLEQFFYDAVNENVQLKLRSDDYEVIKDKEKQLRSGIYFKVVE